MLINSLEKEMATHASILAWRIPWTAAWWATVHWVANSWTWLKQLSMYTCWSIQENTLILKQTWFRSCLFQLSYSFKPTHLPSYLLSGIMNPITCHLQWIWDELCSIIKWWEPWVMPSFFLGTVFCGDPCLDDIDYIYILWTRKCPP